MKTITRLFDILLSQYHLQGFSDIKKGEFYKTDRKDRFMSKLLKYDDDIKTVARASIFYGLEYLEDLRDDFEHEFITYFMNRSIKYQTMELFNAYLLSFVLQQRNVIKYIYQSENYILGKQLSETTNTGEQIGKSNTLFSSLPQDNTNISLDIDKMDYADNTGLSKTNTNSSGKSTTTNTTFNMDNLEKVKQMKANLFNDLDKLLFSQLG